MFNFYTDRFDTSTNAIDIDEMIANYGNHDDRQMLEWTDGIDIDQEQIP